MCKSEKRIFLGEKKGREEKTQKEEEEIERGEYKMKREREDKASSL